MNRSATLSAISVADRFRDEIEKAEADGEHRADMTLHLTHSDVHRLKRDRNVAVADISFAGGEMRYLGVKIAHSDGESVLSRPKD